MLESLLVRGLGIIDSVELEFDPGFSALTGETGAGKSLLVESLKLLAGQRAATDLVRTGDDRLQVEGRYSVAADSPVHKILTELGAGSDEIVIRREVSSSGRSRCWLNDTSVTAATLQRLARHLMAIHGQHEQHGLADPAVQRRLVDDFAGHEILLRRTREAFDTWRAAAAELAQLRAARDARRDRLDVIAFQLAEIDAADPRPDEDEELRRRRLVLRHAVRISELSKTVFDILAEHDDSIVEGLARAERGVLEMVECGVPLEDSSGRLVEARLLVEEVIRDVQTSGSELEGDPSELEGVESRLHHLDQLMLKYGPSIAAVLDHREGLRAERSQLDQVEERVRDAEAAAAATLVAYDQVARKLDDARRSAADEFAAAVEEVLTRLAMEGTELAFTWEPRLDPESPLRRDGKGVHFDSEGVAECVLKIVPNPGEEPRPMARIASGGELSRVHLALRTVLRTRHEETDLTLLFDEVDSGLGGATAAALAELLSDLAADDQVLVVTHLPQVAARANGHLRVAKELDGNRAVTTVEKLGTTDREAEVARMLAGGEVTASAREHARVLLNDR